MVKCQVSWLCKERVSTPTLTGKVLLAQLLKVWVLAVCAGTLFSWTERNDLLSVSHEVVFHFRERVIIVLAPAVLERTIGDMEHRSSLNCAFETRQCSLPAEDLQDRLSSIAVTGGPASNYGELVYMVRPSVELSCLRTKSLGFFRPTTAFQNASHSSTYLVDLDKTATRRANKMHQHTRQLQWSGC